MRPLAPSVSGAVHLALDARPEPAMPSSAGATGGMGAGPSAPGEQNDPSGTGGRTYACATSLPQM